MKTSRHSITEQTLRQIIREELKSLAERRNQAQTAEKEAYELGHAWAMKGMPNLLDGSTFQSYFAAGFEDGQNEFGIRHEGLEDEDALNEMNFISRQGSGTYPGYASQRGPRTYGRSGGARGSSFSGFTPMDAEKLALRLAGKGSNRELHYGDQKALLDWVGQQKFSTSREAKAAIIKYLVGKRFGNLVDYR